VRFQFIAAEKARYPIQVLCRCLGVTRSGYYAWRQRPLSARARQDARLVLRVQLAHAESRRTYGRPRLVKALREAGIAISGKRVARLMRSAGLVARGRRPFRRSPLVDATAAYAPNRLRRRFTDRRRRQPVWAADITTCWTRAGWCYLAVILDLTSRQVVGWAVRPDLTTALPLCALHAALARTARWPRLHHSDRGTQYTSDAYGAELARHRIAGSMSRRGNCWDNAPVESFFSTLKAEAWPDQPWRDAHDATAAIADYIHFYNTRRLHSALGYQSPVAFAASQTHRL
jgi:transposase InsO family protein